MRCRYRTSKAAGFTLTPTQTFIRLDSDHR